MALFPDRDFSATEIDAYNGYTLQEYQRIRDFIILHYKATQRDDTPFWRRCRDMSIPDSLQQKIDLFSAKGRALPTPDDLFTEHSWIAVMLGQGIVPTGYDPLVDSLPLENLRKFVRHVREVTGKTASAMTTHETFIDQNCRSKT
jgi:tryptophan halogenase